MALTSNSFNITPVKGQLTLDPNFNTLSCQIDLSETATLVAGQAVLIKDVVSGQIPVEEIAAITNAIFGFIPLNFKTNEYEAGDQVKVARTGAIMFMEASAAIARGASVEVVISGNKVATQSSGTTIGIALDKAAADGDLIRVEIKL